MKKLVDIMKNTYDTRSWKELGFGDKMKYSLAAFLIVSSVVLGFISFIWLAMIPGSVIATSGLFGSEALALLGISSYFYNELVKFETKVDKRLNNLNKSEANEDEIPNN